jgi:hypothetical protein
MEQPLPAAGGSRDGLAVYCAPFFPGEPFTTMNLRKSWPLLFLALLLGGCGQKGPLQPPPERGVMESVR